jgi:rhamnose transport system substrate-binding protein
MVLLPKFLGILPFDQAHQGAEEAAAELGNPTPLQFLGPTADNSVAGQIEIITTATTQSVDAIMISNNAGDQIVPAAQAASGPGSKSSPGTPIPSAEGTALLGVDFDETGKVMADMARSIMGEDGGRFAILSASPDAANQNAWIAAMQEVLQQPEYANLELLEIVYGNDQSEDSYNQALALVDKYPDMELIMAPTTVGIAAAAKAMQDEGLCDTVKVSGWVSPARWSPTPSTAALRSSPCGASLTWATSLTTPPTCSPPARLRGSKAKPSRLVGWASTPSRKTPPVLSASASSWVPSPSTTRITSKLGPGWHQRR